MKKLLKCTFLCGLITASIWCGSLIADRQKLNDELIRLHVVANSDAPEDQSIKLKVRDAVLQSLQEDLAGITDVQKAKAYLQENLPKIQAVAQKTLADLGCPGKAAVSLCKEAFDTRYYDTFTLPAGVYEALRITIGEGEGKNWWCVAFPTLCLPATTEGFSDVAAGAGFSDELQGALTGEEGCQIRFFLLEVLGRLENSLFRG